MFGMSSEDFWENDPLLYWSYRFSYLKKLEQEQEIQLEITKYTSWLQGKLSCIGTSIAISNAFSKGQGKNFPTFKEVFSGSGETKEQHDIQKEVQAHYNAWARY